MIWITTALFLSLVPTVQEVPPAGPPVDLTPYLVRPNEQRDTPDGFELAFTGEASHRLRFRYGSADAVELEVSVGFPAGGARFERRLMEPGSEKAPVNFDLGPLLGHGPWRPLPADARKGPPRRGSLPTGWWIDTHDPGHYLVSVRGRRVQNGEILFTSDLRLPVQTWVGAELDRLAYIDDEAAQVELWLQKGAPVQELPVEVDLVDARTGQTRSSLSHRRLTRERTRVPFDLHGLEPATYHVRIRPRIDGRL